jgi:hypothetical protein
MNSLEVLYLICLMTIVSVPSFGATTDEQPSAICIQHVGSSDKPIFPIIIGVDEDAARACKHLLGEESQHAASFTISREQLEQMTARTRHLLVTEKKPVHPQEYGTFKITTFLGSAYEQFTLDRGGTLRFVQILIKVSRKSELTETLRSIERRLRNQGIASAEF